MNNRLVMLGGLIPLLFLLVVPHVNAESESKRASDGFNDGSNAARAIRHLILYVTLQARIPAMANIQAHIATRGQAVT